MAKKNTRSAMMGIRGARTAIQKRSKLLHTGNKGNGTTTQSERVGMTPKQDDALNPQCNNNITPITNDHLEVFALRDGACVGVADTAGMHHKAPPLDNDKHGTLDDVSDDNNVQGDTTSQVIVEMPSNMVDTSIDRAIVCDDRIVETTTVLYDHYQEHCQNLGLMQSDAAYSDEVKRITRRYGWKYFKVLNDCDYHYTSPFAECMLDHLGYSKLPDMSRVSMWEKVKKDVGMAMQIARSGATQGLKKIFLGMWFGDSCFLDICIMYLSLTFHHFSIRNLEYYNVNTLPTMEMFRSKRQNCICYRLFCEKFVSCVIGTSTFRNACCVKPFGEYCNVSDEAMTFLILENNWDAWAEIGDAMKDDQEKKVLKTCVTKQKFFDSKTGRGHSWNSAGKAYYNLLFDEITADRENYGADFDETFLDFMQEENEQFRKHKRDKRKKVVEPKSIIICKSDYVPRASRGNNMTTNSSSSSCMDSVINDVVNQAINNTSI